MSIFQKQVRLAASSVSAVRAEKCAVCGGREQLAVIFQRLLCRHCALVAIRKFQQQEEGTR
jgi:hypothetical protein